MNALEILKNNETLFLVDGITGKAKSIANEINQLFQKINQTLTSIESFRSEQAEGDYNKKIYMSKSLDRFFGPNKFLKLETVIANYEREEKAIINNFYTMKNQLIADLKNIIRESNKTAVVSKYDLFENGLTLCPEGHEVIILGGRNEEILNNVLNTLENELNAEGNFNNVYARNLDYDKSTLMANVDMCNQRANSLFSSKQDRLTQIVTSISRLKEVSNRVVAFYTFKNDLLFVGCQPKGVKAYEKTLLKEYIPLKKAIQKELKIQLQEICEAKELENDYSVAAEQKAQEIESTEYIAPETNTNLNTTENSNTIDNESPADENIEKIFTEETQENTQASKIDKINNLMKGIKKD